MKVLKFKQKYSQGMAAFETTFNIKSYQYPSIFTKVVIPTIEEANKVITICFTSPTHMVFNTILINLQEFTPIITKRNVIFWYKISAETFFRTVLLSEAMGFSSKLEGTCQVNRHNHFL
jgi:hypothetical protein